MACGQLQQTGAYPISLGCDHKVTFPEWRTSGECAPLDGDHEMAPAEVAAGAASAEVGAGADPANDQDPEADGGLNDGLAPTDPVRYQSDAGNQMSRLRRRDLRTIGHTFLLLLGAKAACVDAAEMTLTEHGRTMLREKKYQSFNATISSSKQRRRTPCARQSAYTTARWRWNVNSKV